MIIVSISPVIINKVKELPMISSAFLVFPFPRSMEQSGAPPIPYKLAKAIIMVIMGKVTPTPVRAKLDAFGILPIYILSTIL